MLGLLPTTLNVGGTEYKIRSDYRDIFRIISAYNDPGLSDREKVYVCLAQTFVDFGKMPKEHFDAAYDAAVNFIECNMRDDRPSPKIINWEKDEQLIFPAINKVAGYEVRSVPYLHWWTFLGYFQGIDRDDTWGFILVIRQKRAKHKKLEKNEQEFYNANRLLCEVERPKTREEAYDDLDALFNELAKGGAE